MKNLLLAFLTFGLLSSCTQTVEEEKIIEKEVVKEAPKKQLRHVVLFKFKDSSTEADVQSVEAAFSALPGKIPEISDYEWGTNNSPEGLDKGFTHCFFLSFDSEADRAVYLPHPDHKAFGDVLKPHLEDVLVLDYWTGEE
ncbi:MAG: Dabb family protein [Saprospiraceae bacterium]|nr:Dabb family protein [Saprospiraceae bacterium]